MTQTHILLKQFAVSFIALSMIFLWASFTSASSTWAPPTATAPGANTDTPLNTSGTGQIKSGGLTLNTGGATNGLIVQSGKVGIGTMSPAQNLDVVGFAKASGFCMGSDCRSSWAEAGLGNCTLGYRSFRNNTPENGNWQYLPLNGTTATGTPSINLTSSSLDDECHGADGCGVQMKIVCN